MIERIEEEMPYFADRLGYEESIKKPETEYRRQDTGKRRRGEKVRH